MLTLSPRLESPGRRLAGALLCLALLAAPPTIAQQAAGPALLTLAAGGYDLRREDATGFARVEYRHDALVSVYRPLAGALATVDGGAFVYGGLSFEIDLWRGFVGTIAVTPGVYIEGGGRDLGGAFSIRSAFELAWQFEDKSRFGLTIAHMSNAGLFADNPGAEMLSLSYSLPLERVWPGH